MEFILQNWIRCTIIYCVHKVYQILFLGGNTMFKRVLSLLLCLVFVLLVGCGAKEEVKPSTDAATSSEEKAPEPVLAVNPLTGIKNMDPEIANNRPVAITINNISVAQPVQTGLTEAEIVYETEVEGGITRLVAVFQDISKSIWE